MILFGCVLLLTGCVDPDSPNALADGLRAPVADLAASVVEHGAPAPVVSAVRVVVATYEAGAR